MERTISHLLNLIVASLMMGLSPFVLAQTAPSAPPKLTEAPWNGKIYDTHNKTLISREQLTERLRRSQVVVLGEKHYSEPTQLAEGELIRLAMQAPTQTERRLTTAWEFLNHSNQNTIATLFAHYRQDQISVEEFLQQVHGAKNSALYAPIMVATKQFQGDILAVNLSREAKAPVVEKGLKGLPPEMIPPGFAMGSEAYFKRFELAMAGHGTPEKVRNYYEAQCLTDDVIAFNIANHNQADITFLVVGSFHMEYGDGVVARLKDRLAGTEVVNIRILDTNDYVESELYEVVHDPNYGDMADYIYFVNEPFVP